MGAGGGDLPARPAPLDRASLERVLARAAELQSAEGDGDEPGLSDVQLVEIAKEVGLAPVHLRQALAEERSRIEAPAARGATDHLFGPAVARAMRTLRGTPAEHLDALDTWMRQGEGLTVKRRMPDRILWERAPGIVANLSRTFDLAGRGYHLARADEVIATAVPVDAQRALVVLEASLASVRGRNITGGAFLTLAGAAGATVMFVLGVMPLVAVAPAVVLAALGVVGARSHRAAVARAQLSLEQLLDRLERDERPRPSLLSTISFPARPR
jgi:hypothetical protein